MEFYDGELKRECILEEIAADGNKWFLVSAGSTFLLYALLGYFGKAIPEKHDAKVSSKEGK